MMGGGQIGAARLHLLPSSRSWRFNVTEVPLRHCEIPRFNSFKNPSVSQQIFRVPSWDAGALDNPLLGVLSPATLNHPCCPKWSFLN